MELKLILPSALTLKTKFYKEFAHDGFLSKAFLDRPGNMSEEEIEQVIKECLKQNRQAQKILYKAFYSFAMGICLRYSSNRYEAVEIVNQGFLQVLTNLHKYNNQHPIKSWIGKIMINSSIDYYRSNLKKNTLQDPERADEVIINEEDSYGKLKYEDFLKMVQKLPASYRTVFNMFAIEGYSHDEISKKLAINIGTSKSNLYKARAILKEMILMIG
jgi:RNA polymerase sigma-70 factor (ECF subfamily)